MPEFLAVSYLIGFNWTTFCCGVFDAVNVGLRVLRPPGGVVIEAWADAKLILVGASHSSNPSCSTPGCDEHQGRDIPSAGGFQGRAAGGESLSFIFVTPDLIRGPWLSSLDAGSSPA